MPRKRARRLTAYEKEQALLLCEEMLCQRVSGPVATRSLQEQFPGLADRTCRKLMFQAAQRMRQTVAEEAPHRRAQMLASLDRLYERAWSEGKLGVCKEVQALIAKVEGHEKAPAQLPAAGDDGGLQGRSLEELEYYDAHGFWPEDAPPGVPGLPEAEPEFPLQ